MRPELDKARNVAFAQSSEPPENGIDEADVLFQKRRNRSAKFCDRFKGALTVRAVAYAWQACSTLGGSQGESKCKGARLQERAIYSRLMS
jgi:hypothetical protein